MLSEKMDLRVKKTYLALIKSLEDLSRRKNFSDITVNEICDNAMVGRGTFYKHFNDKYDFLSFLINELVNDCMTKASEAAQSDNLCEYYKVFFSKFIENFKEGKYNFNFKQIDNYMVQGVAFSPIAIVHNEVLKHLRENYSKDDKLNRFMAQYLTMELVIVLFCIIKGEQDIEEAKESISFLLEKLFA
ncbi:MAG: TetR/AcrR family transcriptional regulator [Clostridiales bacterium]|nr:TetR/AcrR family transcriptional regulator [Clostridiales bacterium]